MISKKKTNLLVSLCVAIGLVTLTAAPVNAFQNSAPSSLVRETVASDKQVEEQHVLEMLNLITPAITTVAGVVTLDGAKALALGADYETLYGFAKGLIFAGGSVTGIKLSPADVSLLASLESSSLITGCVGVSDYDVHWTSVDIYLNSCDVAGLMILMGVGAGASELAGALTFYTGVGPVAGTVGAFLFVAGAAWVGWCNRPGDGIIINKSLFTTTCKSQ